MRIITFSFVLFSIMCMGYYSAVSSDHILPPAESEKEREGDSVGCQEEEGDETAETQIWCHVEQVPHF